MTTSDWKALLTEVRNLLDSVAHAPGFDIDSLIGKIDTTLTQPEPEGVIKQQIDDLLAAVSAAYSAYGWVSTKDFICLFDEVARLAGIIEEGWDASVKPDETKENARALLARWGRPALKPVPVSERLPEPGDCDAEGKC
jgi:hypothetical protein